MALQKQSVTLSIVDGLDTKTDDKNVISTRFLELENVRHTKTGSLIKRYGADGLPLEVLDGGDISSGSALTTFNDELLLYSNNNLYTFSEANQKYVNKGDVNFGTAKEEALSSNGNILKNPNYDVIENIACFVYESRTGVVTTNTEYRIIDNLTKTVLFTGSIASETAPKVTANANKFFIFSISGTTLRMRTVTITDVSNITSPVSVLSNVSVYDTSLIGANTFVFGGGTAAGANVLYIDSAENVSAPVNVDGSDTFDVFSVNVENTNDVRLCWAKSSSTGAKSVLYVYNLTLALHVTAAIFPTLAIRNLSSGNDIGSSTIMGSTTTTIKRVVKTSITSAGVVGAVTVMIYSANLQSKIAKYNGRYFFIVVKDEPGTQFSVRTFFMLADTGEIISKWQFDNSVVRAAISDLRIEGTEVCFPGASLAEFQSATITTSGNLVATTAIKKFCMDFAEVNNFFDTKLGADLHISGGIMKMYDGNVVVEHGFLEIPRTPTFVVVSNGPTPGIGLTSAASTVQYVIVYSWRDKAGQLHRSAPSIPATVPIPQAAPNYSQVNLTIFTTSFTNKTDVQIEVYRTEENGTVFYRVNDSIADRLINDKTVATIAYSDDYPSDQIIDNEILYTTGGVLENVAADSSKFVTSYKNRVFLLDGNGEFLQYSKLREENGPVEFNDSLKITLDEEGGIGQALAVMDDHIIIFKQRAMFAETGEGPNNLGQQDDFRKPYLITADVGLKDLNSVVKMPLGLMFKSEKGIYLLERSFKATYIGAGVEAYNGMTITSATLLEDANEVRFNTLEGRTLVYDYYHNRWATFTGQMAIDAVNYQNQWSYVRTSGLVMKENPQVYLDNGSWYKIKIVSAWISLAQLQGFERFYKLLFLGNYKSAHKVKCYFAYNFNSSYAHEALIQAGTLLTAPVYGAGDYGDGVYGGEFPLYQFEVRPEIQKCEAFKVKLEDFPDGGTGNSFTLSNLAMEVGIKRGLFKKSSDRVFGAS